MMKYNLKTYPRQKTANCYDCPRKDEWKEGFEKELRKLKDCYGCDGSIECSITDCLRLIKEILGDA